MKIRNQAFVARQFGLDVADRLSSYERRVRSGDQITWKPRLRRLLPGLFGAGLSAQENWVNASLDYGYAVMRGACARSLVAYGMLPSIGLFHDSEQNAFNLADDLIEPFRPLVDLHVARFARSTGSDDVFDLTAKGQSRSRFAAEC